MGQIETLLREIIKDPDLSFLSFRNAYSLLWSA